MVAVSIELRLKTELYETKLYDLTKNQILRTPASNDGDNENITINDDMLLSVFKREKPESEIQTRISVLLGTLPSDTYLNKLFNVLEEELNKKVIYEGGDKHA